MRFNRNRKGFLDLYWSIGYYLTIILRKLSFVILILVSLFLLRGSEIDGNFSLLAHHTMNMVVAPYLLVTRVIANVANSISGSLSYLWRLENQNKLLKQENHNLKLKMRNFQLLRDENKKLKTALNYIHRENKRNYRFKKINILSGANFTSRAEFKLDREELDNYNEHTLVLDENGNLLGRLINIFGNRAEVLLVNDYFSKIPAQLANGTTKLILGGQGGNLLEIDHFLGEKYNMIGGEEVYTAEDGSVMESGIPIGKIVELGNGKFVVRLNAKLETVDFVVVVNFSD